MRGNVPTSLIQIFYNGLTNEEKIGNFQIITYYQNVIVRQDTEKETHMLSKAQKAYPKIKCLIFFIKIQQSPTNSF